MMKNEKKHISFIIAMKEEAKVFIEKYNFEKITPPWSSFFPIELWESNFFSNFKINLIINGSYLPNVRYIGTNGASISTTLTLEYLSPDLLINTGTCGGWKKNNSKIGDVYWIEQTSFHDRRIPLTPYDKFGTQVLQSLIMPKEFNTEFKTANLSTGNSLDIISKDLEIINKNKAQLKDMEGAAINEIAHLSKTPLILIKSVTDLIDSELETSDEFLKNLEYAINQLNFKIEILLKQLDKRWII